MTGFRIDGRTIKRDKTCLHIDHLVPLEWSKFASLLGSSGVVNWVTYPLENICENITHMHKMVNTWRCWHICKWDIVGVETDQVGEKKEKKRVSYGCPGVNKANMQPHTPSLWLRVHAMLVCSPPFTLAQLSSPLQLCQHHQVYPTMCMCVSIFINIFQRISHSTCHATQS